MKQEKTSVEKGCGHIWIEPKVLQCNGTYLDETRECGDLGYLCPGCAAKAERENIIKIILKHNPVWSIIERDKLIQKLRVRR